MGATFDVLVFLCIAFQFAHCYNFGNDIEDDMFNFLKNSEKIRESVTFLPKSDLEALGKTFDEFIEKFGKIYNNEEERKNKFQTFCENIIRISLIRQLEEGTAEYGLTKFADLSPDEFKQQYLTFGVKMNGTCEITEDAVIPNVTLPHDHDWRHFNAVTTPKDQGFCGSCYAFSTTGNIEGQYAIKYGKLLSFSEQEIVDCDEIDEGCDGGEMLQTFESIKKLGGLTLEEDYPYKGYTQNCSFDEKKAAVKIEKCFNISNNEEDMAKWLFKNGPMAVALNANWMQFYMGGIQKIRNKLCDPEEIDHAVLLIGFGTHKKMIEVEEPYWIVKNSWGEDWGEEGYYKMSRGTEMCGINTYVVSAVIS